MKEMLLHNHRMNHLNYRELSTLRELMLNSSSLRQVHPIR